MKVLILRCCCSWCRLSWVSSKSCSRSPSIGHPFISCYIKGNGDMSFPWANQSSYRPQLCHLVRSFSQDWYFTAVVVNLCERAALYIGFFFSSQFLLRFFSRLLAGSKVGFSVLPLALLLCRQMRILTSFNTNKITTWLFLAWTLFSYALGIPANNVSWSGTSGCSCVACHWPDDRLLS